MIGEGGMGRVFAAREESLGRTVAVKVLKADQRGDRSVRKLLQEAWVTGRLQHPNVVPVYRIELDHDGQPMVVLKLVEGDNWASLMHCPDVILSRFGAVDALEWNLRVLLSVCNAVRFAHDQGVIHRDIKPENVMLGAYGEVCLVDWGLALAVDESAEHMLPPSRSAKQIAGTPNYMAPEQLEADPEVIGTRTDVYLLGATLYEIVTGYPPHRGQNLVQVLLSIANSAPSFGPDVPEPLADIARRAMQRTVDDRYPDVETFAQGVKDYLSFRSVYRIAEQASVQREELSRRIRAGTEGGEPEDRLSLYRLFGECRFGFQQALALWPACESARSGLAQATESMVEFELDRGEPQAAAALLAELDCPPASLAKRVEQAEEERRTEQRRLERLRAFMDPATGGRTRRWILLGLGVVWVCMPLALRGLQLINQSQRTHGGSLVGALVLLSIVLAFLMPARHKLLHTSVNRHFAIAAVMAVLAQVVMHAGAIAARAPLEEPLRTQYLPWFVICGVLAFCVDRWLVLPTIGYAVAFLVVCFHPQLAYLATSGANLVLALVLYFRWFSRMAEERPRAFAAGDADRFPRK